jgi:hypothetical protein
MSQIAPVSSGNQVTGYLPLKNEHVPKPQLTASDPQDSVQISSAGAAAAGDVDHDGASR